MFYTSRQKGFTLIELLIVISIIGLLSSVIMVSTDSARKRARLASIQENISSLRTQMEVYRLGNGNKYHTAQASSGDECTSQTGAFSDPVIIQIVDEIVDVTGVDDSDSGACAIWVSPTEWAFAVNITNLGYGAGYNMCADSNGSLGIFNNGGAEDMYAYGSRCANG